MSASRSGNRHLRIDPEGRFRGVRPTHNKVIVRADPAYAAAPSCQHLLQMLINLLARQYGVINEIIIDVPPLSVHKSTFLLYPNGGNLLEELLHLGQIIGKTEVKTRAGTAEDRSPRTTPEDESTFAVCVGPFDPTQRVNPTVAVVADGWRFDCASDRPTFAPETASANPAGPYVGACFASSSVFKYFRYLDPTIDLSYSLWAGISAPWPDLPVGEQPVGLMLPTVYMIGGGAVAASCAFTLAATPELGGCLIVIDPQDADETSRNRLVSAAYDDTGKSKVELIKQLFDKSAIDVYSHKGLWPDYTADPDRLTPAHIRAEERKDRYEWVLSCVDRNIHRRNIAIYLPRHVVGGSTNGLAAQVAYYSMPGPYSCLACHHPVPAAPPTEELRDALRRMSAAERSGWYERHDADERTIAALEEFLNDPDCGAAGAAELARLGREGETDWSVGFVSVAAGVIQASTLLQLIMRGIQVVILPGNETYAWFARPNLGQSVALKTDACDVCGDETRQQWFADRWR